MKCASPNVKAKPIYSFAVMKLYVAAASIKFAKTVSSCKIVF